MTIQSAPAQSSITIDVGYLRAKRRFDLIFTLIVLIPLCIIIVIVAILIRLDSEGPVFFRQRRVGRNGVVFDMFKFRSMYHQCDEMLHRRVIEKYMADQLLNEGSTSTDLKYKLVDDPRVTRVGRFLRKTSIDELPQFFNVLRNEMSLVGPRPPLPYEVERYNLRDLLRLSSLPGLTGPWQVYGRCRVPFATMVDMDIAYLQRQSFWEDLKLVVLTIPVMLKGHSGV